MGKKMCWLIILFTMSLNVVMLQGTIEAYYGKEYDHVFLFTAIAMGSILFAAGAFIRWRKLEYK